MPPLDSLQSISLRLLRAGERGTIARTHALRDATARTLKTMGLVPGQTITLVQRFPRFVVKIGSRCHCLDDSAINAIYIRTLRP
ncbi:MAG: ferrous iron transport protein A [Elainella sp.]